DHANTDIQQAKALGLDAFALNLQATSGDWLTSAVQSLFQAANQYNFKLFFSFDMDAFQDPSQFIPFFQQYVNNSAYYHYQGKPFTSTFYGGNLNFGESSPNAGWQIHYRDALLADGIDTYFVPSFCDNSNGPNNFFENYPVVDGVMGWDSAWVPSSAGKTSVSDSIDKQYIAGARAANKTYMMPISSVQFKHIDSNQNWYLRGELALAERMPQILADGPDFVEILTWNDSGESHYIGNAWPEAIAGTPIPAYTDGYDHSGWQHLIPPFIQAVKCGVTDTSDMLPLNGLAVTGAFWYRPLLGSATCPDDSLGKPSGWQNTEDSVLVALFSAEAGNTVNVYSNGALIGSYKTVQGLNKWDVGGIRVGTAPKVTVLSADGNNTLTTQSGSVAVQADTNGTCNFNYQVLGL
ncbi:glycoside hydrolase family 71 protein, partial [Xylona heveae TC161]